MGQLTVTLSLDLSEDFKTQALPVVINYIILYAESALLQYLLVSITGNRKLRKLHFRFLIIHFTKIEITFTGFTALTLIKPFGILCAC